MASVRSVEIYDKPRGLTETIRINKIKRTGNPNYLFLDLELGKNLEPGEYNFYSRVLSWIGTWRQVLNITLIQKLKTGFTQTALIHQMLCTF